MGVNCKRIMFYNMKNTCFLTLQCLFVICFVFISHGLIAQKSIRAKGFSEVKVESNMTKEQAREKAEELAKINAIENEFGTYIAQETDIHVTDGRVDFDILGSTMVRGEWVRTIGEVEFNEASKAEKGEFGIEQNVWIQCNITGEIRECISRANLFVEVLNCPLIECRKTTFYDEESLYLYFKSPVDGFLSVFIDVDGDAYRLIPYKSMGTLNAIEVEGDKEYILFSKKHNYSFDRGFSIDALELGTDRYIEYNTIYVVFSENEYAKPILDDIKELDHGYYLPRSLSSREFKKWIGDCKAEMPNDFQVERFKISIEKK